MTAAPPAIRYRRTDQAHRCGRQAGSSARPSVDDSGALPRRRSRSVRAVREHVVRARIVCPGAAYLELARAGALTLSRRRRHATALGHRVLRAARLGRRGDATRRADAGRLERQGLAVRAGSDAGDDASSAHTSAALPSSDDRRRSVMPACRRRRSECDSVVGATAYERAARGGFGVRPVVPTAHRPRARARGCVHRSAASACAIRTAASPYIRPTWTAHPTAGLPRDGQARSDPSAVRGRRAVLGADRRRARGRGGANPWARPCSRCDDDDKGDPARTRLDGFRTRVRGAAPDALDHAVVGASTSLRRARAVARRCGVLLLSCGDAPGGRAAPCPAPPAARGDGRNGAASWCCRCRIGAASRSECWPPASSWPAWCPTRRRSRLCTAHAQPRAPARRTTPVAPRGLWGLARTARRERGAAALVCVDGTDRDAAAALALAARSGAARSRAGRVRGLQLSDGVEPEVALVRRAAPRLAHGVHRGRAARLGRSRRSASRLIDVVHASVTRAAVALDLVALDPGYDLLERFCQQWVRACVDTLAEDVRPPWFLALLLEWFRAQWPSTAATTTSPSRRTRCARRTPTCGPRWCSPSGADRPSPGPIAAPPTACSSRADRWTPCARCTRRRPRRRSPARACCPSSVR